MAGTKTIRTTGKGKIKVHPDMTRITITLEGIYKDYSETLKHSGNDTDTLKETIAEAGFMATDLKTLSFSVDTEYEGYKDNGVYKNRFVGYKYRHIMKLEFDSDNKRLGKILYALANCKIEPEFRLSYTVKDTESPKNELLEKAVTDAKRKAEVLTEAAGVKLKEIQSIDYSWGEMNIEISPMHDDLRMMRSKGVLEEESFYGLDIEPDDIDLTDIVTVVWEIE